MPGFDGLNDIPDFGIGQITGYPRRLGINGNPEPTVGIRITMPGIINQQFISRLHLAPQSIEFVNDVILGGFLVAYKLNVFRFKGILIYQNPGKVFNIFSGIPKGSKN